MIQSRASKAGFIWSVLALNPNGLLKQNDPKIDFHDALTCIMYYNLHYVALNSGRFQEIFH